MIGPLRIDAQARAVFLNGKALSLGGRAFDLLLLLARAEGDIVGKDVILDRVWRGVTVDENNIQVQITALRKALGEGWIGNVQGRGYRIEAQAGAEAGLSQHGRPTLAVLPFVDLTDEPGHEFLADALTSEITTELSRFRWFQVIARSSAFSFKDRRDLGARAVGRALGVRYLLEGTVQRSGQRVRMSGSLVDVETGLQVWTARYDGDTSDLFALQDQISASVAGTIVPGLRQAEIQRARKLPTDRLDAYELYLRSLPLTWHGTRESYEEAATCLRRAIAIDTNFIMAKAFLSFTLMNQAGNGWGSRESIALGTQMAGEAFDESHDDPETLRLSGHTLAYFHRDYERSLVAVNRARAISPNAVGILMSAGWVHCYRTDGPPAIEAFTRGLQLNPMDTELGYLLSGLGLAHLARGEDAIAIPILECSLTEMPNWMPALEFLVVALHRLGRREEASNAAQRLMASMPRLRTRPEKWAFRAGSFRDSFLESLTAAGVPD